MYRPDRLQIPYDIKERQKYFLSNFLAFTLDSPPTGIYLHIAEIQMRHLKHACGTYRGFT